MIFDINEGYFDEIDTVEEFDMNSVQAESTEFDDEVLGSLAIALHMETAYTKLTEAVGIMELSAIANGENPSQIYETSDLITESKAGDRITSFFKSAKAFIIKWAGYIKGFFIKCFKLLESVFATNKQFLKDNEKTLKNADTSKVKFNGYKYTITDLGSVVPSVNKLNEIARKEDEVTESDIKAYATNTRKDICGESSETSMEADADMRKYLFKKFRNGNSSTRELSISEGYGSVDKLISILSTAKDAKKKSNDDYSNAKKTINNAIKSLKDLEKTLKSTNKEGSNDKLMTSASKINGVLKTILRAENSAHSEHIKALRAECLQARAVAGKLLFSGTKVKDGTFKNFKESTDYAIDNLANLEF